MELKRTHTTSERLKEAMAIAGKRQIDIVRETGLDSGAVSSYVSGKYEPKQPAINKMAISLDVSEMWLWGYDVPRERTQEQKKSDELVKIVARLRRDSRFRKAVFSLDKLPDSKFDSIINLLTALEE